MSKNAKIESMSDKTALEFSRELTNLRLGLTFNKAAQSLNTLFLVSLDSMVSAEIIKLHKISQKLSKSNCLIKWYYKRKWIKQVDMIHKLLESIDRIKD